MTINITKASSCGITVTKQGTGNFTVSNKQDTVQITRPETQTVTVVTKGPKGDTGPAGPVGPTGATGSPGVVVQSTPPSNTSLIWVDNS